MSKLVDETLAERRPLPRLYAHYHRLLIDLLEDLTHNSRGHCQVNCRKAATC